MKTSVRFVVVAGAMTFASIADAGVLYTVRTNDGMLRSFDTNTLTFSNVGTLGVAYDFGDLAYDQSSSKMYMVQGFAGSSLYTVNLSNGAASLVGNHGHTNMFGLAYDSSSDTLYGSKSTTGQGFYSFNRNNGAATLIGNDGRNYDALTYDPTRNLIIGAFAGPGDLYAINPNTGIGTLIYDGDFFNNCGMAYDRGTDKIWMIDWSGIIYTFDPNNGYARTTVLSGLEAHDGFASADAIPTPAGIALLGMGAMVRRRRRA